MNKLIIILALCLSGCASFKEYVCGPPLPPIDHTIHIDPRLLEPCKPLLPMDNGNPTFEDYLLLTGDNAIIYVDCKKKQDASILFLKKVTNGNK